MGLLIGRAGSWPGWVMPCAVVVGLLEDEVGFPCSCLHMLGVELGAGAGLPAGGAESSALIG